VVNTGFPLVLGTEAAGGIAQDWRAAYPILRGIGYWQVPLPLAETLVAALLLSAAGLDVPEGPLTLIEQGQGNDLRIDGRALTGSAQRVPWARHALAAVVSLADGRIARVDLRAPGITVQPRQNHARLPSDSVRFEHVACAAVARNVLTIAQPVWTLGAIARCAMLVGALESALEQSVRYAGERVQFGKPIGKNQALQQQLALMAGDVAAARISAVVACADAPSTTAADVPAAAFSAAVAKVRCGEAATRATSIAHQVHGAIGFTHEHALHFATKRLWAWREEFGSDADWAAQLGRAAIAGGSAAFWPAVTRRCFGEATAK
jgi:acyl-CoA dehydrogenase